MKTHKCALQL